VPINNSNRAFGARVRVWRDRLGFSQEKLAELAGLHRTYVSDVERGARNLSLHSILKLAAALHISAATLLMEGPPPPGRMLEILLVADDAREVELTLKALRGARLLNQIQVVSDGAAALEFLLGRGEPNGRPHLILLDLGRPKRDGLAILKQIKANPRLRDLPVVVLVGAKGSKNIAASKRLGADGHVVKPVNAQNLWAVAPGLNLNWALLSMESGPTV
jgi:CheY-like chemotaxis protein